jgi:hypothetical protein
MDAPIAPPWLALGLGMVTLVVVAGHLIALRSAEMPESRRRIRTVSGTVILIATPLTAYALGIATPADAKAFTLSWSAVMGLLGLILILAFLDMANNARIYSQQRRDVRESLRKATGSGPTAEQRKVALAIALAADRIAAGRSRAGRSKGRSAEREQDS